MGLHPYLPYLQLDERLPEEKAVRNLATLEGPEQGQDVSALSLLKMSWPYVLPEEQNKKNCTSSPLPYVQVLIIL
jgi:hypothetical protein